MLKLMGPGFLAAAVVVLSLAGAPGDPLWAQSAGPTQILEIRGSKLVLYGSPDGRAVKRVRADEIALPLEVKGVSPNGRYEVEIGGEAFWIAKAQAKKTNDAGTIGITAKCQAITKSFASTRGLGNCN